nr:NADH dehydrogenase subunit 6 [Philus antennatus]
MMIMLSWMMMTLSITFLFLNHPLSFGLILLMQTLLISLISGLMNQNYWYSYILFLIMVGGMLILFIYMTSIASNEMFKFSFKILALIMVMFLMLSMLMWIESTVLDLSVHNSNMINQEFFNNSTSMSKYFNLPNTLTLYMIIIYLLITLIMVVKITNLSHGPLRQKF